MQQARQDSIQDLIEGNIVVSEAVQFDHDPVPMSH